MAKRKRRNTRPRAKPAHWGREQRSDRFTVHEIPGKFRSFAEAVILPQLKLTGYKLAAKREAGVQCLHNVVLAGLVGHVVADSRDNSRPGVALRVKLWDAMRKARLVNLDPGSEQAHKTTRYWATAKLTALFDGWQVSHLVKLDLVRNSETVQPMDHALVVLHSGTRNLETGEKLPEGERRRPIPFPAHPAVLADVRRTEDAIERINRSNTTHSWQAFREDPETGRTQVIQPNVCLRVRYSGGMWRGGRLSSWSSLSGQGLPKAVRKTLLIDGEPTVELDFKCSMPRVAYHLFAPSHKTPGDLYCPDRVFPRWWPKASAADRAAVRKFVKRATNILLNVPSRSRANSSVAKLLAEHPESDLLYHAVFDVERSDPRDLVKRLLAVHEPLARVIFWDRRFNGHREPPVGMFLQFVESWIMLRILTGFAEAEKPVLGIHDAVVCKAGDEQFARRVMRRAYRSLCTYPPVIDRK